MPSIEALAMAGADCDECGIHLEDVEKRHTIHESRPQYLQADQGSPSEPSTGDDRGKIRTSRKRGAGRRTGCEKRRGRILEIACNSRADDDI
uniref:Uncharacterized protein n=1 Tax=Kalanchoe fedtschenkoi TaxID=63787 RepID=A0A7N0TJJ8_KALFE